jgi:hypothetical protein
MSPGLSPGRNFTGRYITYFSKPLSFTIMQAWISDPDRDLTVLPPKLKHWFFRSPCRAASPSRVLCRARKSHSITCNVPIHLAWPSLGSLWGWASGTRAGLEGPSQTIRTKMGEAERKASVDT